MTEIVFTIKTKINQFYIIACKSAAARRLPLGRE